MPRYKIELLQGTHRAYRKDASGNRIPSKNKRKGFLKDSLKPGGTFVSALPLHLRESTRYRLVCVLADDGTEQSASQVAQLRGRDEHILSMQKLNEQLTQERDDALALVAKTQEVIAPDKVEEAPPVEPVAKEPEVQEVPEASKGKVDDFEDLDMLSGDDEEDEVVPQAEPQATPPAKKAPAKKTAAKKTVAKKRTRSK